MHFYTVTYDTEFGVKSAKYQVANAGQAFAHCQKDNPNAKMLKASCEGKAMDGYGYTEYDPPPVQRDPVKEPRPARGLRPTERGCELPFYDEVRK